MLVFRCLKPCQHCAVNHSCEFVLHELERSVARVNEVAVLAERSLPEGEVIWDCASYFPKPTKKRG